MKTQKKSLGADQSEALDKIAEKDNNKSETIKEVKVGAEAPSDSDTKIKTETMPKAAFNTKKVAELVNTGAAPSVGVAGPLLRAAGRISYSGSDDVFGDKSSIGNSTRLSKSGDRQGRQMDTALSHVDDSPAETFIVPIDTIPDLRTPGAPIGYNGKYRNEHAITQKGSGGCPADSDFFRTLDEMQYDICYFGRGQINTGETALSNTIPVSTFNKTSGEWESNNVDIKNSALESIDVVFDEDGTFDHITFNKVSATKYQQPEHVLRVAADTQVRMDNLAELDRLSMIDKASDETKDNWSPLGKVIPNSRTTNLAFAELDKIIGDYAFLSVSKLSTALAYQLNKAAKDGQRKVGPIFEMLNGNIEGNTYRYADAGDDDSLDSALLHLFAKGNEKNPDMNKGSAAMYIAIMDSTTKYNTKSKFLALPLSFKTALATAKQNIGELRMHKEFYDEFNKQEVFGKIEEDGSGITPYFISDGAKLFEPIDIFGGVMANASTSSPISIIHHEDLRNKYNNYVYNYFIAGLTKFIKRHQAKIVGQLQANDDDEYIWHIPAVSTTTCLSMWDLLVCAAMKDIAIERRYAMDVVIQYEAMNGYPYSNALKLEDATIGGTSGVGFTDISTPLRASNIPLQIATRILMPETFWVQAYAQDDAIDGVGGLTTNHGVVGRVILPFYFSQDQFISAQDDEDCCRYWALNPEKMSSMTFFDYRGGSRIANADRIFSMDQEQFKLSLDRMVIPPAMEKQITDTEVTTLGSEVYKYAKHEDGIPVFYYYIASKTNADSSHRVTLQDIMSTPRELGLSFIAPAGFATPTGRYNGSTGKIEANYVSVLSSYFKESGTSFRARCWSATPLANVANDVLEEPVFDGDYAVNLAAHYYVIEATPDSAATDIGIKLCACTTNGVMSLNTAIKPFVQSTGDGTFNFNEGTYSSAETVVTGNLHPGITSNLKYMYTRINLLPFIINPFDVNTKEFAGNETTSSGYFVAVNNYDVFDYLHFFNLCGFRCGEYQGLEYDRTQAKINLGIAYVDDPYIQRRQ